MYVGVYVEHLLLAVLVSLTMSKSGDSAGSQRLLIAQDGVLAMTVVGG